MAKSLTSFRMFMASCTGNAKNTIYKYPVEISTPAELAEACKKDHVCTEFAENRRSSANLIKCHAIMGDCDNDDTEDPAAWITPATVAERLPGVAFYAVKSRNCDKVKHPGEPGEKGPRPRWHYYFVLQEAIPNIAIISSIMLRLLVVFPEFDKAGMKPAQFFYGHAEPVAEYHAGNIDIAQHFMNHPEITFAAPATPVEDPEQVAPRAAAAGVDETDFIRLNVRDMLAVIPADDRKVWTDIGMALKAAGCDVSLFDEWSRKSQTKYKGFNDCLKTWNSFKSTGVGPGTLVHYAQENGWQSDPDKLTGEAKRNHEQTVFEEEQKRKYREAHREVHAAQLAALGIDCAGDPYRFTWTLDFDGSIDEVIEKATGDIVYHKTEEERAAARAAGNSVQREIIQGIPVITTPGATDPATDPAAPWESITKSEELPAFPLEYLPGWIRDYIVNFSENTGISKDFCAACVFGAVSTVVCGHLSIHFNGTHYEPANLYTVFVGRSGSMKSTAINQFVGPARAWLMEKNKAVKAHNQSITAEIETIEEDLSKEQRKRTNQDEKQIAELKARIEHKRECLKSHYPVPFTDVVPESIIKSMMNTNGAATIATAEGNIINVLTGRSYTQRGTAPNLDIFLAGYDGEPYHGIRVTSGEVEIPHANISILMAIQPTLLETLCLSADANGRGLVQRFLIFAPEDTETTIDHTRPNTTDPNHARRWNEHIRTIADRFMQPNAAPVVMELFNDADTIIRECWNYERELINERGAADEDGIIGWISKLHGKALRLASILAVLDEPKAINITKEHAETAVALLKEYFIPHYIGSYETGDILTKDEKKIISWIIRRSKKDGNQESFSEHELKQAIRLFYDRKGQERFRAAIEGLQDKNYIRPLHARKSSNGRKPGPAWQINPELFTE